MEKEQNTESKDSRGFKDFRGIIIALIAVIGLTACVCIFTNGLVKYKTQNGSGITATGSASCDFESDLIVWRGNFSTYGAALGNAYEAIKRNADVTKKYLISNGVSEDEIVFSSVYISKEYNSVYNEFGDYLYEELVGYTLYQNVCVTSSDIDKIEKISRDSSALIASGVEFTSEAPEYYYTKLDELKLQLIADATENAKARIDLVSEGTGSQPGELLTANLGVFQITARNSSSEDYSYGGTFNTSSREKTATITVKLNYAVN